MSFDRHHPNREVDRNLAKARELRSAHVLMCLAAIGKIITSVWRLPRRSPVPDLEMPAGR
jgi:hypothetical protein